MSFLIVFRTFGISSPVGCNSSKFEMTHQIKQPLCYFFIRHWNHCLTYIYINLLIWFMFCFVFMITKNIKLQQVQNLSTDNFKLFGIYKLLLTLVFDISWYLYFVPPKPRNHMHSCATIAIYATSLSHQSLFSDCHYK